MSKQFSPPSQEPKRDDGKISREIIDDIKKKSKIDADVLIKKINEANFEFFGHKLLVIEALAQKEASAISSDEFVRTVNGIGFNDEGHKGVCISYFLQKRIPEVDLSSVERMIEGLEIKDTKVARSIMDDYNRRYAEHVEAKSKPDASLGNPSAYPADEHSTKKARH